MLQFMNRKKVRSSLIQYFKLIPKCQQQIQTIQQQLISHPRFNPIVLYNKIAKGDRMTVKDLKDYCRKQVLIQREEGLKMYLIRHDLKKTANNQITIEMFLQTLLPYTPNCLRQANDTILRQLQTEHIDMTVEALYHKLILTTTQCLYMISLFQREIGLSSWDKVQAFMVQDIVEKGKRIDLTIKETTDVIYVRKWMELWIQVDEYQVLNMIRFFNGGDELSIIKLFNNHVTVHMKCTCQHGAHQISHRIKNAQSHSKSHAKQLNKDYFSSGQHYRMSKSRQNIRFYTEMQGHQKHRSETQTQQRKNMDLTSNRQIRDQNAAYTTEINQTSNFPVQNNDYSQRGNSLNLFLSYITILVDSQKQISLNRMVLLPYKKQVQEILHDIMSKKKNWTKCEDVLFYIERFLPVKKKKFQSLIIRMGNTRIENSIAFSLFWHQKTAKKSQEKTEKLKQLTPNKIMQTLASVLYKFISTRSKLIEVSEKIVNYPMEQMLEVALKSIGKERKKSLRLKMDDLKELFMMSTSKPIGKQYLALLMDHLGKGNQITAKSLIKVLNKQASSAYKGP